MASQQGMGRGHHLCGDGRRWLYLSRVMDLASRRIVGWSMSDRIKADLVNQALQSAYWLRKPPAGLIMHTDRGSTPARVTGN
jgi:putative transposase